MSDKISSLGGQKLIDHITALRKMLMHCILAIAILFPVGFFLAPRAINALAGWCLPTELGKLNYFSPMEVFIIQLKLGVLLAFIFSFPYVIWRVWEFLVPALYENEKKILKMSVLASAFLFFLGTAFCVVFILPLIMKFSAGFAGPNLQPMLGMENFLNLCAMLILAFGLMFQSPLIAVIAVKLEIVSVETLQNMRPYIIVAILILSAILTPPDVLSQLMLGIPTWLLFEAGLVIAKIIAQKNETADITPDFNSVSGGQ